MERNSAIAKEDEIDLFSLFTDFLAVIKKNKYYIIAIILASVLISAFQFFRESPYYKTRMIADSGTLPNTEIINIVESWQRLIDKSDYITLAAKLKLPVETVAKINKIEAEDTQAESLPTAKEENENSFMIGTEVTEVQILDTLEYSIVYALENNEYVKKRAAIKKQNMEALKAKISAEIAALDSVKLSVRELLGKEKAASGTFLTSPSEVNLQIINLYERILALETSIQLSDDIQIIESFTKAAKPDGPDLIKYLNRGFAIGCVLAVLYIIMSFISKKMRDYRASLKYSS